MDPARIEVMIAFFANWIALNDRFRRLPNGRNSVRAIPWSRAKLVLRASRTFSTLLADFDADIVHTHNIYAELVGGSRRDGWHQGGDHSYVVGLAGSEH